MKTIFYLNRKVELDIEVPEELVEIQCFLFSFNETGYNLVPVPDNYGEELQTLTKEEFETELSVIRDRTLARLSPEYNINLRDNSKEYPYRLNIPYKETDLAHLKSSSIQSLLDSCREAREVLASTSDTIKLAGYNAKVVIANAVLSDSANPYQIYALQQEVDIRGKGESLKDLAQKIIKNSYEMSTLVCILDGIESKFTSEITKASNAKEIVDKLETATLTLKQTILRLTLGEQKPVVSVTEVQGLPSITSDMLAKMKEARDAEREARIAEEALKSNS